MTYRSLRQDEAAARRRLLQVESYDVSLDLAGDDATFTSRTEISFTSSGGATWVDLRPSRLHRIAFNGSRLDPDALAEGRYPLRTLAGVNELVVEATMAFRNDGEGLHRSVDPADGRHYVYGMSFMEAAPSIFACFDQPDLKAPWTFHVRAPRDWVVIGNAPGSEVEPGVWEFDTTPPLSTYFVTLVAGPYHVLRDEHDEIPLGLSARASLAADLDREADELFELTRACFDEFHRLFGIRYPFGDYHQAFVPEFNAGAMENPGCVTFRDPLLFSSRVTRGQRIGRATTIAHEMAHQWFGDIVTPVWWDDLWLNESFAEYLGNRVTADVTRYADAWTHNAYSRRQWGLIADQRPSTHPVAGNGAADAAAALGDFDGISYAKGSAILKQLNATIGDAAFLAGTIDHIESHRFGNATMHDLVASWERAGAGDLSTFVASWLRTSGADTIELDRAAGVVRRRRPSGRESVRTHALSVATAGADGAWLVGRLLLDADETEYYAPAGRAVVLDPGQDTWALTMPDDATLPVLARALPRAQDANLRAGAWSNLATAFHNARLDPADALDVLVPVIAAEDNDDALAAILPWGIGEVAPLSSDPDVSERRLHEASLARATSAEPGSTVQLAAFRGAIGSAADPHVLRGWLADGVPEGVIVDLDLRWSLLVRLARLGATTRDELHEQLAAEPTTKASVAHTCAVASLPDKEAKAWAWERFTGAVPASNYHIQAAGTGMWRRGHPDHAALTTPYAEAWLQALPTLQDRHEGWVLGTAVTAFAPITLLDERVVAEGRRVLGGDLAQAVRRGLSDSLDTLARRIAVVERYRR